MPTPSWTVSFTMPTASNSPAKACAGHEANRTRRLDQPPSPVTQIHRPARLATRAASFRYGGRHHSGIPGDIIPLYPGDFVGIRTEYRKVEEHEPVHPRLWAEMSPPPTRFNRRNAEWCRWKCSRRHSNASVDVWRLARAEGRTQPNLRQRHRLAASKGKDCDRQPHRCVGSPTYERGKA